jgi:hypothetical protein
VIETLEDEVSGDGRVEEESLFVGGGVCVWCSSLSDGFVI